MFSACEDCLFLFPADMTACPVCHQASDWLCQTYDVDACMLPPEPVPASTAAVR